jgi:hypothetical protein
MGESLTAEPAVAGKQSVEQAGRGFPKKAVNSVLKAAGYC